MRLDQSSKCGIQIWVLFMILGSPIWGCGFNNNEKVPEIVLFFLEPFSESQVVYLWDVTWTLTLPSPPTRALPFAKTLYILLLYICAVKLKIIVGRSLSNFVIKHVIRKLCFISRIESDRKILTVFVVFLCFVLKWSVYLNWDCWTKSPE